MSHETAPEFGTTGICRTCVTPISYEKDVDRGNGYLPRDGWTDHARVDALICFSAIHYAHVPLEGRELAIWNAAIKHAARTT